MKDVCGIEARKLEELVAKRLISKGKVVIRRRQVVKLANMLASSCSGMRPEEVVEQRGLGLHDIDYVVYGEQLDGNRMLLIPLSLESRLPPHLFKRLVADIADAVELYDEIDVNLAECEECEDVLPPLDSVIVKKLYTWLRNEDEHSWDGDGLDWYYGILTLEYGLGDEVVRRGDTEYRRVGRAWIAISRRDGGYYFRYYVTRPMDL